MELSTLAVAAMVVASVACPSPKIINSNGVCVQVPLPKPRPHTAPKKRQPPVNDPSIYD